MIRTSDADTLVLLAMADKIRQKFRGNGIDFCAIVNARSGHCPENCRFCAQSGFWIQLPGYIGCFRKSRLLGMARQARDAGAARFSLVTSGRNQDNAGEFEEIIHVVKRIRNELHMEVCCSLGLITREQALRLKEAGITRFHCNIETAPSYFPSICSTHTMEDKERLIRKIQDVGIRVCSGGILGLGETLEQRVEMAFKLKEMHIDSVPLNILNPVRGTPFAHNRPVPPLEILRDICSLPFCPSSCINPYGRRA